MIAETQVIDELVQKADASEITGRIVNELKGEAEPYRKMVMETITKVVATLDASDIDMRNSKSVWWVVSFIPSRSRLPSR